MPERVDGGRAQAVGQGLVTGEVEQVLALANGDAGKHRLELPRALGGLAEAPLEELADRERLAPSWASGEAAARLTSPWRSLSAKSRMARVSSDGNQTRLSAALRRSSAARDLRWSRAGRAAVSPPRRCAPSAAGPRRARARRSRSAASLATERFSFRSRRISSSLRLPSSRRGSRRAAWRLASRRAALRSVIARSGASTTITARATPRSEWP